MVRFLALASTALILAAAPLSTAQARAHKPEPASHHGKKTPAPKGRHGRDRDEEDDAPRGRHAPARHASHDRQVEEDCVSVRGRHGRKTLRCTPVRENDYAEAPRHKAKPRAELARNDLGRPYVPPPVVTAPPAQPKSIDDVLAAVDAPPAPAPVTRPAPTVIVPLYPDSPAGKVKHANPAPGIIVVTNPDLWAERRQAEHRNHELALRVTVGSLVNRSDAELRSTLGTPDLQRTEGDGALWTYRLPSCSLMVFLHRSAGATFKVTGATSGPLASGGAYPDADACLRGVR